MLATAANRLAARLVGINTGRDRRPRFAVSAAIGAIGGMLMTPITLTSYDVGTLLALKGFAAAMLGGMGNPLGAVVGGLIVGLLEAFGAGYRLVGLQGRDRLPGHPRRAVRHAAWPARPRRGRACLACAALAMPIRAAYAAVAACSPRSWSRCRSSSPTTFYLRIAALVFIFALAVRRAQSADGLCRTGQPRPRRLLRHRRLRGRASGRRISACRPGLALLAGAAIAGLLAFAGRPADPAAEGPLPRGGDARPRHSHRDGVHQRGAPRPAGPTACRCRGSSCSAGARAAPIAWYWISGVDAACSARWLAVNLIDSPTGRALRAHPRQRDRGARARHRRRALQADRLRALGDLRRGRRRAISRCSTGCDAGHGRLPALDRVRDHGGARRPRLDPRRHRRRGLLRAAAAGADRVPRLRAHRARPA